MAKYRSGDRVSLTIQQETEEGYVLSNGSNQVMLKTNQQLKLGDQVEVFLYHDQKNQLIATDQIPTVSFSAFDWAEVVRVHTTLGVFVDIGSNIEVLVSTDDLPQHMTAWPIVGDQLYVTLKRDKKDRLLAQPVKESDFEDNWDRAPESLFNQDIKGRVFRSGKEGAVIISEDGYRGFIHYTERKKEPRVGEWVEGRVIEVKQDGTLNVSLLPRKQEARLNDADMILTYLKENNGEMLLNNQSDPEEIQKVFGISKSAFKRAIGKLYKDRLIKQAEGKTYLILNDQDQQ